MESVRIDKYLWSIRLFKTRTSATKACNAGKVKIKDESVKPSYLVKVGETVNARVNYRVRTIEVVKLIEKRVGAEIAKKCYIDYTPEQEALSVKSATFYTTERRDRGTGRPTKKERREIEDYKEEKDDLDNWEEW